MRNVLRLSILLRNNGKVGGDSRKASGDSRKIDEGRLEGSRSVVRHAGDRAATSCDVEASGNDVGAATPSDLEYSGTARENHKYWALGGAVSQSVSECLCFRLTCDAT
jgi:hypothetical protein